MFTDESTGATAPVKRAAKKRPGRSSQSSKTAGGSKKESRVEEVLHELFRRAGLDTRGDKHADSLVDELVGAISGKGNSNA